MPAARSAWAWRPASYWASAGGGEGAHGKAVAGDYAYIADLAGLMILHNTGAGPAPHRVLSWPNILIRRDLGQPRH